MADKFGYIFMVKFYTQDECLVSERMLSVTATCNASAMAELNKKCRTMAYYMSEDFFNDDDIYHVITDFHVRQNPEVK